MRALLGGAPLPPPRRAGLRRLLRPADGAALDEALVLRFPAPASATGEDIAELHCHGSPAVVSAVLDALSELGVRAAEPGEFTRRAFEAGRLDLTQVEGLADLLAATTEAQRVQAATQADGALRRTTERWRGTLMEVLATVEALIDFSDEADVGDVAVDREVLQRVADDMARALAGFAAGERVREGVTIAITGPPNAGKSSLFNTLLGRDAAIVSPTPGTTRDVIEGALVLDGVPVVLLDTAGLREADDPIEAEGVRRARERAATADIRIHASEHGSDAGVCSTTIVVASKSDLSSRRLGPGILPVSTVTGAGLAELRDKLVQRVRTLVGGEPKLVTRCRQERAIRAAHSSICQALSTSEPVLMACELQQALDSLAALVGRRDVEHMLDLVFSRFCIGK